MKNGEERPEEQSSEEHREEPAARVTPSSEQVPVGKNGHGNGHFAPSPHARAGARVLLTALGKNNGEGAKALVNGLARIAMGTEPNPWPILALWKHLRDTVDGLPKPAPEVKDPRRLARIILTNGHASAPPADAADPAEPLGEHEEGGERFVSMPPLGD